MSGLLCATASWLICQLPLLRGLDNWMFDGCFSWRGPRPTQANVVLVTLDDASLDDLHKPLIYTSPELAEVVGFLKSQGAAAIGLDVIIPDSLTNLPELQADRLGDATLLGRAISDSGNVVLAKWRVDDYWLLPLEQWQFKRRVDPQPTDLAFVDVTADDDNFLRRQQLYIRDGDDAQMHFGLALLARSRSAAVGWQQNSLRIGDEIIPLDDEQRLPVNFVGPPGAFPRLPFRDVLAAARRQRPLRSTLNDAIVIVGVTARSQQDYHATPYANNFFQRSFGGPSGLMAGSELHAHVIATLVDRAYVRPLPGWASLLLLLCVGAALGAAFARLGLVWGAALCAGHHFAWKAICVAAFQYAHVRLDILPMLLLGLIAYAATFAVRWRRLQRMLGVVKSTAIARALEADPRGLDLRGEERVITVLFADIRDFTTFSEAHSPHQVVALLNGYFSALVPIIERHGGVLNQYLGDGMMVLFGAPLDCPQHALRAVETAVAMVRRVHDQADRWTALGCPSLRIGVGIHTGRVIVGNIGSPQRLDYTAIGDTVNSAARIEGENKRLGSEILISSEVYQSLSPADRLLLRCADTPLPATVKGREQPLKLHAVAVE